jgi:HEAT repeat protein
MAPYRLALIALLLSGCRQEAPPVVRLPSTIREQGLARGPAPAARLLWLSQHGQMDQALELAADLLKVRQLDLRVLESMGIVLLRSGLQAKGSEEQLLTLIGASIAGHESTREILQKACHSDHPLVQIHALQGLAQYADDETDREMIMACGSRWLPVRLTAAELLASKRSPHVIVQVEAMLAKLPALVHPLLPSILAKVNTPDAIHVVERQLASRFLAVRIAAIDALRAARRDDCCPRFRELATHDMGAQAEACAFALGTLGDESAIPLLHQMLSSPEPTTQLAAACALDALGERSALDFVRAAARQGNPYAIAALSRKDEDRPLLRELLHHRSLETRIHAMWSLLELRDGACLPMLRQMLRAGATMPVMQSVRSPGHALFAFALRTPKEEDTPHLLAMKERLLMKAIELPEAPFLALVEELLDQQQTELVPLAIRLLENLHTPEAVALLKRERQRAGAPLARIAAALALYRLGEPGPWEQQLLSWLREQAQHQLISLKQTPEWDPESLSSPHELSPEQTSGLILEALEALVQRKSLDAQLLVLDWLRNGHPRNRYVLAGILMHMAV